MELPNINISVEIKASLKEKSPSSREDWTLAGVPMIFKKAEVNSNITFQPHYMTT